MGAAVDGVLKSGLELVDSLRNDLALLFGELLLFMQETTLFLQTTDGLAWGHFEFDLVGGLFLDGPDLDIIDWEEADLAIEFADPPATVELVLDADDVALFEGEFLVASGFEGVNRLALLHERRHLPLRAVLSRCIVSCETFLWPDLGAEAVYRLSVIDLPCYVASI